MTKNERTLIENAHNALTSPYVSGNSRKLGTVGELDLLYAIQRLKQALDAENGVAPND